MPRLCQLSLFAMTALLLTTSPAQCANLQVNRLLKDLNVQYKVTLASNGAGSIPSVVAKAWTSYALTSQLSAGVDLRHTSRVHANASGYTGSTLLDVNLTWQLSRNLTIVGRLRSVAADAYGLSAGSANANFGIPSTGDISLEYRF